MKRNRSSRKVRDRQPAAPDTAAGWILPVTLGAAAVLLLIAYGPALHGPFVFDDLYLPFLEPSVGTPPLSALFTSLRPLMMLSFWMNRTLFGPEPFSFHLVNVIVHFLSGIVVFVLVRRFLEIAGRADGMLLPGFAAAVFLFHPVQTEAVAYVASRSEVLSVLFGYGVLAVLLRRDIHAPVTWPQAFSILLLLGLAVASKEHTAILPAALVLTHVWWRRPAGPHGDPPEQAESWWSPMFRNWRLYLPLAAFSPAAGIVVWSVLTSSSTAGFTVRGIAWYEYFFTQCRAVWVYIRLYLLPVGLNVDYGYPISRTIFEHGAWIGMSALAALLAMCWRYRNRYPLEVFGILLFLLLLAPTSSVVPIQDAITERRLYLPFIGLLLTTAGALSRLAVPRLRLSAVFGVIILIFTAATHHRSTIWADPSALWRDVAEKSPHSGRAHFQLAYALYEEGKCAEALDQYAQAAERMPEDQATYLNWALAHECLGQGEKALERLRKAASIRETAHVYSQIGMVLGKQGRAAEAREALERARNLNPNFDMTYVYLGNLAVAEGRLEEARQLFLEALSRNPANTAAQAGIRVVRQRSGVQ